MTLLLLHVFAAMNAQTQRSEDFFGESHTNSFDARDIARFADELQAAESRTASPHFNAPANLSWKWIDRIQNMPQYLRDFYVTFGEKVQEVLNGQQNWLSDPSMGIDLDKNGNYCTEIVVFNGSVDFTFPKNAPTSDIQKAAREAAQPICNEQYAEANTFMIYLGMSLSYDNAEAFWLSGAINWSCRWGYSYTYNAAQGTGVVTYRNAVYLNLKDEEYDCRRSDFQTPALVASGVSEFKNKVNQILSGCPQSDRYSQIKYLNNWLTMNNSYNSVYVTSPDDALDIAWCPLSALRGSTAEVGPVCESYSRAFKVLCDQLNIPCMLVVGYAKNSPSSKGESHMWNEVKMDDNKWYAVDVTWNDPFDSKNRKVSGMETELWLLLGKLDLVYTNFTFEESHPNTITWGTNTAYQSQWDYSTESLIADYKYVPGSGTVNNYPIPHVNSIACLNSNPLNLTNNETLKFKVVYSNDGVAGDVKTMPVILDKDKYIIKMGEEVTSYFAASQSTTVNYTIDLAELSAGDYYASVLFYIQSDDEEEQGWHYNMKYLIDFHIGDSTTPNEPVTVTIGNALVAGFSSNQALDFTSLQAQGVSAWIATGFDRGNVQLSRVYQVPAGEGVYVKAEKAGTYEIPTMTENPYYMNMFVGTPNGATVNQYETYHGETFLTLSFALSKTTGKPGFFPNTEPKTYGKNKMYLHMPARLLPEYAKARISDFSLDIEFVDATDALVKKYGEPQTLETIGKTADFLLSNRPDIFKQEGVNKPAQASSARDGYKSLGMGTLTDNFFKGTATVEILEGTEYPGYYRILNPYDGITNIDGANYTGAEYMDLIVLEPASMLYDTPITMDDLVYFRYFDTGMYNASYGSSVLALHPSIIYDEENLWTFNKVLSYQSDGKTPAKVQLAPLYYLENVSDPDHGYVWDKTQEDGWVTITFPGAQLDPDIHFVSVTCSNTNLSNLTKNDKLEFHATFENKGGTDDIYSAIIICDKDLSGIVAKGEPDYRTFNTNTQVSIDYELELSSIPAGNYYATVMFFDDNHGWTYLTKYLVDITIVNDAPETVTIGNALVAGFSSNQALDFTSLQDKGVSAWIATGFERGNVQLSRIYRVPAGEGIYVKANKAGTYEIPTTTEEAYYMNMFVGTPNGATVNQYEDYYGETFLTLSFALSKNTGKPGFFPNTEPKTYGKNKMYLHMPARLLPEYAKTRISDFSLGIEFIDEEATGISDATYLNDNGEMIKDKRSEVYDLQGRRVDNSSTLKKGLYIVNGKKVFVTSRP